MERLVLAFFLGIGDASAFGRAYYLGNAAVLAVGSQIGVPKYICDRSAIYLAIFDLFNSRNALTKSFQKTPKME